MDAPGSARWQRMDLSNLVDRLEQARVLLEQAAAMVAVQDVSRVAPMAELQRRLAEEQEDRHGHADRRRYR